MVKKSKFSLFILFPSVILLLYFTHFSAFVSLRNQIQINFDWNETESESSFVLFTEGCSVPKLDPFDKTVLQFYKNVTEDIECPGKRYLDVIDNILITNVAAIKNDFGDNFSCTYRAIYRNPKNITSRADNKFEYGEELVLKLNEALPSEFVKAFCEKDLNYTYEEFLLSTPIKPLVEERCKNNSINLSTKNPLNVIVIGIDSISKLNFERHFKLTSDFLRYNLSTYEFHGYMKVADNTFPNLTPMLTGHFINHYYDEHNRGRYFDALDFIWKNFSSVGYRTFLAEDAPDMATYNYAKNGFQYSPTDYFFRPLAIAVEDSEWQKNSKKHCFQAKPEIRVLFDYLRSFLTTMQNRPYFAFTWAARLTHNNVNNAGYADKPSFEILRDIRDMGLLNSSMLIFVSDHGIRFGGIRGTYIGKIEERMPFLFISMPKWFLNLHQDIAKNLEQNQHRLTTPFDIHESLVDLYQMMSGDYSYKRTPYGVSLFQPISVKRNCGSAYILPHWCVCHSWRRIPSNNKLVRQAAQTLLKSINSLTDSHRTLCSVMELDSVLDARVYNAEDKMLKYIDLETSGNESSAKFGERVKFHTEILLTIRTQPGDAEFESTLTILDEDVKVGEISRINMYGHRGDCIDSSELRKYCNCKNM